MTKNIMKDIFVASENKEKIQESIKTNPYSTASKNPEKISILSTFCNNPKGISFQGQKPNESIIIFLRSHFITNLPCITIAILLIILPIIIWVVLPMLNANITSSLDISRFIIVYVCLYYLIVFSYVFVCFLHWFYSVFIATTQQVVDIDYSDVVIHHIAVTSISHVQDVRYTQSGFIPTFLNYGNIFVQTAGTELNFQEFSVPKPREATYIIGNIIGKGPMRNQKFQEEKLK
ncbi:MAG: hypothetical protein Q8P29_03225 [Candidatus Levybacteria bacterium]|nr:hypothetical protein [Candidatus Levybacteria bacterium]